MQERIYKIMKRQLSFEEIISLMADFMVKNGDRVDDMLDAYSEIIEEQNVETHKKIIRGTTEPMVNEMLQVHSKVNWLFRVIEREKLIAPDMVISPSMGTTYKEYAEELKVHMMNLAHMIELLVPEMGERRRE